MVAVGGVDSSFVGRVAVVGAAVVLRVVVVGGGWLVLLMLVGLVLALY